MKKKILAIALLGAMTLSMNSVAFAADTVVNAPEPTSGVYKADVDVSTEVSVPTIKITVPGDTKVAINPYKMAYEMDSVEYTDVLANAEKAIKNESDVAISVSATASAKASEGSEVVLATTALKGTETTKSVFAYLEVAEKTDESTAAAFAESFNTKAANQLALTTKETTKKGSVEYTDVLANAEKAIKNESDVAISVSATASAKASEGSEVVLATTALKGTETTKSVFAYLEVAEKTDESTAAAFAESFNTKAANQLALTTKETTKKGMITLAAGDATATYAGFKILGDAAAKPAKAWTTADKMDISLVFSFDPVVATDGN